MQACPCDVKGNGQKDRAITDKLVEESSGRKWEEVRAGIMQEVAKDRES